MLHKLLTIGLPLILPTVAYLTYLWFRNRNIEAEEAGEVLPEWRRLPWPILIGCGAILVSISLGLTAYLADGEPRTGTYVPAYIGEDGKIVPGHYIDVE